jgi:hypothetical protein
VIQHSHSFSLPLSMRGRKQKPLLTRLQQRLPQKLREARMDLWPEGRLWDKESAKPDFSRLFRAADLDEESNSFHLYVRPFPGIGLWDDLGRFPGHYLDHITLINFMHGWCRDFLELGRWEFLDNTIAATSGARYREFAMRTMRYLSHLREEFLLWVDEYRQKFGDTAFKIGFRVPTIDLHLLALFHGYHFSITGYDEVLTSESGRKALAHDPLSLGERVSFFSLKIILSYRLGCMA